MILKGRKFAIFVLALVLLVTMVWPYSVSDLNHRVLQKSIAGLEVDSVVYLNDVIPFEWDAVYSFGPYTPKEYIAETIGFNSIYLKESVCEGLLTLVFVNGRRVVCSVSNQPTSLGYDLWFSGMLSSADNPVFHVKESQYGHRLLVHESNLEWYERLHE